MHQFSFRHLFLISAVATALTACSNTVVEIPQAEYTNTENAFNSKNIGAKVHGAGGPMDSTLAAVAVNTVTVKPEAQTTAPHKNEVIDIGPEQRGFPNMYKREVDNGGDDARPPLYSSVSGSYKGRPLDRHIGDYIQKLTQELVTNMEYVNHRTPIGVTNFALLDSDLNQTNLLGQQMAESFIHELHKFKVPVIDFKLIDNIRVTPGGDFVLSRDYLELARSLPIEYVLTGTITRHQGGMLVNARLVGLTSQAVVATAQTLVPFYVVDAVLPSNANDNDALRDGVGIIKG